MTNKETNLEAINTADTLEDLNLQESDTNEVKGGPAYMKLGDIKGEVQTTQGIAGPAAQTREHILLARQ